MIKNIFKVAIRNLLRNKVFSIINISGLAIGMASAIVILLWMYNEISYDRFHAKKTIYTKHGTAVHLMANCNAGIIHLKFSGLL